MSHTFGAALLVPLQTSPGPVLVITALTVVYVPSKWVVMLPTTPCGNERLVNVPEPAIAPVARIKARVPTLTAPTRAMVLLPFSVRVPQLTNGAEGLLAAVTARARVAPGTVPPPFSVKFPRLSVPLPFWTMDSTAPSLTVVVPPRLDAVVICSVPAFTVAPPG